MSVEGRQALSHACRLLSYRQRSERELETRLRKKGFGKGAVGEAIGNLKDGGYLDDRKYALDLRRMAEDVKLLGAYGARQFLTEKGVQAGTVEEALAGDDERAVASQDEGAFPVGEEEKVCRLYAEEGLLGGDRGENFEGILRGGASMTRALLLVVLAAALFSCVSYVRYSPSEIESLPPGVQENIKKGEIVTGMSPLHVRYAWGPPNYVMIAEPDSSGRYKETWVYTKARIFVTKLTFTDGKLTAIVTGVATKAGSTRKDEETLEEEPATGEEGTSSVEGQQ
jgi:regulatory protein